jgi:hypothetical protein
LRPPTDAPTQLTVDIAWQWIFGISHIVIALAVIYVAARRPVRERDWAELRFRALVLVGGALGAILFEGVGDRATNLWYAVPGQWRMVALMGVHVPLWLLPVYLWLGGGFPLWFISKMRSGAPVSAYYRIVGSWVLANIALEVPILRLAKLYTYYGPTQPLFNHTWFPVPAWVLTTNAFLVLLPALLVMSVMSVGRRGVEWTIPLVIPAAFYMCYAGVAFPTLVAMQGGMSKTATTIAAVLTMALGCVAVCVGVNVAPRLNGAMDWYGLRVRKGPA